MIYILPRYLLQGNLIILIYLYKYWYIENTEVFQFFNSNNIIPLFIAHHWVLIQKSVVCLYCCFQLANCILPGLPSGVRRWEAPFHPRRRVMSQGAREPWGNSREVPPLRTISLQPASQLTLNWSSQGEIQFIAISDCSVPVQSKPELAGVITKLETFIWWIELLQLLIN